MLHTGCLQIGHKPEDGIAGFRHWEKMEILQYSIFNCAGHIKLPLNSKNRWVFRSLRGNTVKHQNNSNKPSKQSTGQRRSSFSEIHLNKTYSPSMPTPLPC